MHNQDKFDEFLKWADGADQRRRGGQHVDYVFQAVKEVDRVRKATYFRHTVNGFEEVEEVYVQANYDKTDCHKRFRCHHHEVCSEIRLYRWL